MEYKLVPEVDGCQGCMYLSQEGKCIDDMKAVIKCAETATIAVPTLTITVNNPSPTETKIIEIMSAMTELLIEKNRRYGDSAITPKNVFSKLSGEQGILIRLDDKLSRVMNSNELRTNDICDLIGYETLLLIARNTTKEEILKLID